MSVVAHPLQLFKKKGGDVIVLDKDFTDVISRVFDDCREKEKERIENEEKKKGEDKNDTIKCEYDYKFWFMDILS